jgi:hypothetical protein
VRACVRCDCRAEVALTDRRRCWSCVVHSNLLQGRGRGARVATAAKSAIAVANVIRNRQLDLWSKYDTIGEEDRSRFYQLQRTDMNAGPWRLGAFMVIINKLRLQRKTVKYLWGQWRGVDASGVGHLYRAAVSLRQGAFFSLLWLNPLTSSLLHFKCAVHV